MWCRPYGDQNRETMLSLSPELGSSRNNQTRSERTTRIDSPAIGSIATSASNIGRTSGR